MGKPMAVPTKKNKKTFERAKSKFKMPRAFGVAIFVMAAIAVAWLPYSYYFESEEQISESEPKWLLDEIYNSKNLILPVIPEAIFAGFNHEILPFTKEGQWDLFIAKKETDLEDALKKLGVSKSAPFILSSAIAQKELSQIAPGETLLVQIEDREVEQLAYVTKDQRHLFFIKMNDSSNYVFKQDDGAIQVKLSRVELTLDKTLSQKIAELDLPNVLTSRLSRIFKKDVNFRRVSHKDKITFLLNAYLLHNERVAVGDVEIAEFKRKDRNIQRLRFAQANGEIKYLRPDGDLELKKPSFDRRPVRTGRLSSRFGMRRHPISRIMKKHRGTDFAAPRGTKVYATAEGKVFFVGRKGGFGKAVVLKHNHQISTLYAHMSGFAKGLKSGQYVKRGQLVGYVGSTGTSTGNHLHYEFRVNGVAQDPMKVKLPSTGILSKKEMMQFKRMAKKKTSELNDASLQKISVKLIKSDIGG